MGLWCFSPTAWKAWGSSNKASGWFGAVAWNLVTRFREVPKEWNRFREVPKWSFHSWNVRFRELPKEWNRFREVPKWRFHSWNGIVEKRPRHHQQYVREQYCLPFTYFSKYGMCLHITCFVFHIACFVFHIACFLLLIICQSEKQFLSTSCWGFHMGLFYFVGSKYIVWNEFVVLLFVFLRECLWLKRSDPILA